MAASVAARLPPTLNRMLRNRDKLLILAIIALVGVASALSIYRGTLQRDTELSACEQLCIPAGKKPSLGPISTTQISKFGGFSGPSQCTCIP